MTRKLVPTLLLAGLMAPLAAADPLRLGLDDSERDHTRSNRPRGSRGVLRRERHVERQRRDGYLHAAVGLDIPNRPNGRQLPSRRMRTNRTNETSTSGSVTRRRRS